MPYLLIPILQIACLVHVLRTGRDRIWVFVVLFLPGIGVLAYLFVEILPGLWSGRAGQGLRRQAIQSLDPGRNLRQRRDALEAADTVDNRRLLAEDLLASGQFAEALTLYRGIVTGIHAEDPGMLLGLAKAAYGVGGFDEALETVRRLGESNPQYHAVEAQLLYARSLEALDRLDEAAAEYAMLVTHAPGEEVRCRYAQLLQRLGRHDEAKALFDEVLTRSRRAPGHYRRQEREWIDIAHREAG
jgi:hypothetical protein